MKKSSVLIVLLFLPLLLSGGESISDIKQKIIKSSISSYRGNCPCPYNTGFGTKSGTVNKGKSIIGCVGEPE